MALLHSMRARIPFSVAGLILKGNGLSVGHGWGKTIERYPEPHEELMEAEEWQASHQAYLEHVLCGEKSVRFYHVDDLDAVHRSIRGWRPDDTPFSRAFPYVLEGRDLDQVVDAAPRLAGVVPQEDGVALVFAAKRFIEIRQHLDRDEIDEEVRAALGGVDEIIAVRRGFRELFDVVWVPFEGEHIEVRIDNPKDMPSDYAVAAHERIISDFMERIGGGTTPDPLNLFPVISGLYLNGRDGTVVEMSFATGTASVKHEKMRKRRLDLRQELYHRGGLEAVAGEIDPFRISVTWDRRYGTLVSTPEASLHGSLRVLHSSGFLSEAIIRRCTGLDDYNYVIGRLMSYL